MLTSGASIAERVAEVERALAAGVAQPLKQACAALDDATQRLAALLVEATIAGKSGGR